MLLNATTNPTIGIAWCCRAPKRNELPSFRVTVTVCPSSQSSLRLDLDSCLTQLHYIALPDASPHLLLHKTVLGVGEVLVWCQKLAWVSPAQPRLPSDSKSRPTMSPRDKSEGRLIEPPHHGSGAGGPGHHWGTHHPTHQTPPRPNSSEDKNKRTYPP